jgi:hypothetical protein
MREWLSSLASLLRQGDAAGPQIALLLVFLAFGVLVPWRQGFGMLDPLLIGAYAVIGILFTTPAAPALLTSTPATEPPAVLARLAAAASYGWIVSLVLYGAGLVTINWTSPHAQALIPGASSFWAVFLAALASCFAAATLAGWLTLRFSAKAAQGVLRLLFLLALVAALVRSRLFDEPLLDTLSLLITTDSLPRTAAMAAVACLAAAALFAWLCVREAQSRQPKQP